MIPLWLLPVFILILHPKCSLFRAEGGCPRNENGQQHNWRYAVYERKEKGLPHHKEIWKLVNIENMSWENHRPILPSFKYNFSDLILPTIRTVQLPWSWLLVYHDEFILTWWIYFDMMNLFWHDDAHYGWRVLYTAENLLYVTRLSLNFQKSILEKSTLSHKRTLYLLNYRELILAHVPLDKVNPRYRCCAKGYLLKLHVDSKIRGSMMSDVLVCWINVFMSSELAQK